MLPTGASASHGAPLSHSAHRVAVPRLQLGQPDTSEMHRSSLESQSSSAYSEGIVGGVLSPMHGGAAAVATGGDAVAVDAGSWSRTPGHVFLYDRNEHVGHARNENLSTIAESVTFTSLGCALHALRIVLPHTHCACMCGVYHRCSVAFCAMIGSQVQPSVTAKLRCRQMIHMT